MSIKDAMRIGALERLTETLEVRIELLETRLEAVENKKKNNGKDERARTARASQR